MSDQPTAAPEQVEGEQTKTIVRRQPKPLSLRDPAQLARAFAESGYWKHVKVPAQAVVIMAAGEELGLTPLASMQGITMIEGNIGYRGNLIATLLRQHPRYEYKVLERTNEHCTLQFTIDGEPPEDDPDEGRVTYSVKDAERAELVKPRGGWVKNPRAMCFNRALTEGTRVHAPDLTAGTPVYSTEEIEEVITEPLVVDAEVVDESAEPTPVLTPEQVEHLAKGYELAKPALEENGVNALDGLNLRLGSLDLDAFNPNQSLPEQLAKLTKEQAEALDADLQGLVDATHVEGNIEFSRSPFNGEQGWKAERGGKQAVALTKERAVALLERMETGGEPDGE